MDKAEISEYLNQIRNLIMREEFDAALDITNQIIAADKMNTEAYIEKGIIFANKEQYDDALDSFNTALKINKKCAEALFHVGNIRIMMGDRREGLEYYNKAINAGYDNAQLYINLGLFYEEEGKDDLAARNYSRAIIKDPSRAEIRVAKAQIYVKHMKYEEALETINELILFDPDLYEGYRLKVSVLTSMNRMDEAQSVLDEAKQLFPKDARFALDEIEFRVSCGECEEALRLMDVLYKEYELTPAQKRSAELEKVRIYAITDDGEKVIESLLLAKEYYKDAFDGFDAEADFLLISCYINREDYAGAVELADELITTDALQFRLPAYYLRPFAYAKQGEREKANELYKEGIDELRKISLEQPHILDAYFYRALCLRDIGDYDKSIEIIDYIIRLDKNNEQFVAVRDQIEMEKKEKKHQ